MKLLLDQYAGLDSVIHRWEQRTKLIGLGSLIVAFAFIKSLPLIPIIYLMTFILYYLSRLPLSFLLKRLRYPSIFIISVVCFLPFFSGKTIIWQWGLLSIKSEGIIQVILIASRFVCILTVSLVLFGTASFLTTIKALRSLGFSSIIVDMMLLSYRYLEQFSDLLLQMQRAMKLRGFEFKKLSFRNLTILSRLIGSLFIRSYEQAKRVYQAMKLRGYGSHFNQTNPSTSIFLNNIDRQSLGASMITIIAAMSLIFIELSSLF